MAFQASFIGRILIMLSSFAGIHCITTYIIFKGILQLMSFSLIIILTMQIFGNIYLVTVHN